MINDLIVTPKHIADTTAKNQLLKYIDPISIDNSKATNAPPIIILIFIFFRAVSLSIILSQLYTVFTYKYLSYDYANRLQQSLMKC